MADWNTHLYCANKVNESLQLEGRDLDLFLFGCLLPDINMGWLITPKVRLEQAETHFDAIGQEYFWAPLRFYEKYKEAIHAGNPLYLGYLFHLWLDVSFMTNFVSKVPMSEMISNYHKVREIKWKDAGLFIRDYKCPLSAEHVDEIVNEAKAIEEVRITKKDLLLVVEYMKDASPEYEGEEYFLYTEEEFAAFYEKVCQDFIGWTRKMGF